MAARLGRGVLHDTLPPELAVFLDPPGAEWDAPLQGEPFPSSPPGPDVFEMNRAASGGFSG